MFTILKVREKLENHANPGWYQNPTGTVASLATKDQLEANGITIGKNGLP